ncbi:MAG: (d)CMP kinase [Clostridiales bacterium]|jgi:cytidylate kinase|nr:(d)CMP kinase [Clostridiales bacterium]
MKKIQIAIDGPAGSGKSTVAKEIANRLNILYLDTGAMYRAVTYIVLSRGQSAQDSEVLKNVVDQIEMELTPNHVFVNGKDISDAIRTPNVSQNVSFVAMDAYVREKMVELQKKIAGDQSVVMDGRDIATHVLPDADFKFFLVASSEERAKRRQSELSQKGYDIPLETLIDEIDKRDKLDSEREVSPLRQADDAIRVDTTKMTIEEVIGFILERIDSEFL